ncbi:hypothetical protein SNE40_009932 [Patella caerulea]|uniref:G-protein coupled receptors family 1 profile domain-containing protein n=1 Tax=Patella caerulea TaxID=87958 RepID=A0AAN8JTG9_PATCE
MNSLNFSTNYSNETGTGNLRTLHENVIWSVILFVVVLEAIIGNLFVIISVFRFSYLREEISNLFIVNLSITDLSTSIVVMLSSLGTFIADVWPFGKFWCYFVCAANYCLIIVSMMTLCFISIDRYVAIVYPFYYPNKITKKRVICMIFYTWFQGILFSIIPVLYHWIEFDYWEVICAISWYKEREQALYYVIFAFLLCFLLPGLVLAYCYCRVLTIAHQQHRRHQEQRNNINSVYNSSSTKYSTSSKAVKSLLIVVLAYFLCMTPFSCTKLYKVSVDEEKPLPNYMSLLASIMAFCSSAVNPLIYGIFRKDFRHAYKKIWMQIIRRNSVEASSTSHNNFPLVTNYNIQQP